MELFGHRRSRGARALRRHLARSRSRSCGSWAGGSEASASWLGHGHRARVVAVRDPVTPPRTRMYSLSDPPRPAGYLALRRALERPSLGRLALVAVLTGRCSTDAVLVAVPARGGRRRSRLARLARHARTRADGRLEGTRRHGRRRDRVPAVGPDVPLPGRRTPARPGASHPVTRRVRRARRHRLRRQRQRRGGVPARRSS